MFSLRSLGMDVLLEVLEHLPEQSDVARMSRASNALHTATIRHLLRFGVTVSREEQLASFVAFLSRDLANRAPQVRKFYIKINMGPDEDFGSDFEDIEYDMDCREETKVALRLLCDTLAKTTELEDLSIDSCEEVLKLERGMLGAIVALEKLRRLQVSSVGELTASLFKKIKSSLVEVDLHCFSDGMDEPDDLVPIVGPLHGTLERLSASYIEVQDAQTQFPLLRALALRKITSFDAPTLRKAFPNLTYLELSPGTDYFENAEELRESSLEEPVDGSWSMLEHLCGGLDALYGVGITQAVKRVDVDDFTLTSESLSWLHSLVRDTSPSRLLMHIGYHAKSLDGRHIRRLLAVPEASNISHLMLDLCLSTLKASAESLMDGLVSLLSPISTTFFVLRLNKFVQSDERASEVPRKCNFEVYEAFQPQRLATACPQIKHICFDVMGHTPTYWTVTRSDGEVTAHRLEPMVGRELVHREGLWFNDRSMGLSEYI
ncbi:hypothetical protein OH76DRAFT_1559221 [Lentinus brumalis]|uniref:F-box domain-containing protein n=1 Tax=Lentinus brumalis TaxID=2498619 RepID=A0A371CYD0_9APHY|nr:hypothetical protein OH76DRAFT_1559221 [Polyporus brumalis]